MEQKWLSIIFIIFILSCTYGQRRRVRIGPRRRIKDVRGTITGEIKGDTYNPNVDSVIPGSSTLAFVFDVTGSMWDDLKQVTAGARQILDTTRSRVEKPLHNYVLIPFHDPVVGPTIVTSNPRTFTRALKNLYVQGGGDCPEMSVTAIREALLISLPGSFIYVFTDARSKDFHQLPEVLKIIQRKQSQVVFVLTGDCDDQNHKGYKAYEKIAATSSGQVFLITKDDVSEVVKFIEVSVQAHKVLLLATDHARGGRHDWSLPFDPELHEITISLSGPGRRLTLVDPDGITMTEENGLETLLDLENVHIVNIKNPKPGTWRLSALGTGEHSLRVTGLSTLDFQARFSRKPTFNWTETEYQPVAGIPTYILINATGLETPGRFRTLRLLDIAGRTLSTVSLSTPRDPNQPYLYTVEPLTAPNRPFYLVVFGTTMENYHFLRASKNAIINVAPVAPVVDLPTTYPGYFDYPADIPCEVSSLIPFDVQWSRETEDGWTDIGEPRSYRDSTIDYLRIEEVTEAAEGTYKCFARNTEGVDFDTTFLDVEERPPIITTHGNVTVTPGGEIALTCHVTSSVRYSISWSRVDGEPLDRFRTRKLQNGSLLIQRAQLADEAMYRCTVVNIGGESDEKIGLIVQRPPVITINPSERSSFSLGGTIRIDCTATGLPTPSIEWLRGSTYLIDIGKIRIGRGGAYLEIVNANQDDEGIYTCQATNRAGSDSASVQWLFTEVPVVTIPEADMLVLEGTRVTLRCEANGIPTPQITWSRESVNIVTGRKYEITPDGSLVIYRAARTDTGVFECTGTNSAGSSSVEVNLQVGWNPVITNRPRDIAVNFGSNTSLPCVADGFPEPEISWFHGRSPIAAGNPEEKVQDLETHTLFITALDLDDEGLYTCTATNVFSSVTATAQLTVTGTAEPRLDVGDVVPHVIVGQSIVIPCRIVSGNPLPTREWTRRRSVLQPSSRVTINDAGSIVIYAATVEDAGPYVCTASNVIGSDSRRVDLDVWVPPSIQRDQRRYYTIEDSPVSIPCVANGNPTPKILWQRAGFLSSLADRPGYEVSEDGTLTVLRPTADSNGMYRCTASNPAGSDSIDVELDVYLRPRFGDSPDRYTVIVGESVTMECQVVLSDPPPTYTWAKDGSRMSGNEEGIDVTSDGRLTISASKVTDAGRYTCVATNVAGVVQRDMMLDVLVPPKIRRGPSLIKILVTETATLTCHASGLPTPTIFWMRGNDVIIDEFNSRFQLVRRDDSVSLIIENTELGDDDDYICTAENTAGRDSSFVSLDVQRIPEIGPNSNCVPTLENNQCTATPIESGGLTLTCNATGDPPPTIRWYRNGEELDDSDPNVRIDADGTLTLYVVTRADNGQYICEAENERGVVTEVTNVEVHERPEIEGGEDGIEKLWVLKGEDIDLTCEADAVPPPVITWYRGTNNSQVVVEENDHIAIRDGGSIFRLTRARISDTDIYKCTASNRVGTTNKFIRLDVYVQPSIQDNDDVSVQIVNLYDATDLRCLVKGIPFPKIQWFKGAEKLDVDNERMQLLSQNQVLRINSALVTDTSSYKCVVTNRVGDASKHFDLSVHVPPSIRGTDAIHTVTLNDPLTLQCIANGIPLPSVQWTFNDVIVTSRPGLRLTNDDQIIEIENVQVADEGNFVCTATNDAGRTSRTHTVIVHVPPSIDGDDVGNVTVTLGGNVTLTCDAAGDPPPTIVWMKDGFPIIFSANENIKITNGNRILTITNARESDRGDYTCVASNEVGEETQTHSLDVLVPPVIRNPNEEVIAIEHETTTLSCRVYGHPFPDIRWETFGYPVVPSEKFRIINRGQELVITDVLVADAKLYTCIAANSVGRATKQVNLNVHVPATITYPAENRVEHTVIEAERYELRCVANGIPIPEVTWFKDGDFLNSQRNFKIRDDGRVLVITKAEVSFHEGAYECIANNGVGDDSREMSLIVNVPPLIHGHSKTKSKVIDIGRSEMLECRIKKGKPTPEIRWYNRDNQEITPSRGVVFTNNKQRLHLLSVQLSDVGNYWCEATNIAGKSRKDFNLDVIVPPNIRGQGDVTKVSVVLDGDITLECLVTGIPTPNVTWVKEGTPVSSLRTGEYTVSAGGSRLTLSSATEGDAGMYECVAVNTAGNSSKSFQLDVYLPPSIVGDRIENITVIENSPVTMLCDVDAFPPPQITWFKNSRPLLLGPGIRLSMNDSRLDILWAQEQDTGMYHCEAVNEVGKQRKYFRLKVHVVPTISGPPNTRLELVVGDQIRMMCDYDGVPRPSVEWTMDNTELPSDAVSQSDGRVLFIADAAVGHSGIFACNASNVAGYDVKTYEVIVYEPPSIRGSDAIERVIVSKGDRIELECLTSGTPVPDIVWNKNRRRISRFFDRAQASENGRYLTVDEADLEDAGKYACTASNLVGVATKRFEVEIRVPPRIQSSDEVERRWVLRGNNISLTCDADAVPLPTLQWQVNGMPLVPSPRIRTQQAGKILFVSSAKDEDAAMYRCVATNVAGSTSRDIQLDVYSTPSIPGGDVIDTHDVNRGRPFSLECNVVGHPRPDIEWLKDGYRIASTVVGVIASSSSGFEMSEDGRFLNVGSADLQHTGDYTCRAVSEAGEDSKQYQVNVRVPPSISDEDSSPPVIRTHVNTPTLLRCSAYGIPSPTIQWLHVNGSSSQVIDVENNDRFVVQFGGRYLRITNTLLDDEGDYTCIATNPAGYARKDFKLIVNVPPVIEGSNSLVPTSVGVPTNQTITLNCVIEEGNPFPTIMWWSGRQKLEKSVRVLFSSDNQTLEVLESKVSDTGRYQCTAINEAGEDSKLFDVEVQTPPQFPEGEGDTNVDVNEGSPLHIHCKIVAVPMPELAWYKDGELIQTSNDVYIFPGGRTLQIVSAKPSDAGRYTCVATNNVGSDEKNTDVTVNVPPTIGDGENDVPDVVRESVNNPFTLQCPVTGYPIPTITWYKNGVALNPDDPKYEFEADGQVLTVQNAQEVDSGHYDCRAKNKAGQDSKVFHVNVQTPPSISGPSYQKKIALQNTAVVMPCDASGTPEPTISWLKDELPLSRTRPGYSVISQGRLLIILQAQTADTGNFTCVASNVVGKARKTYDVITHVAPLLPTTSGDITVSQGETAVMSCQTNAVPRPEVQWTKNGRAFDFERLNEDDSVKIILSENEQILTILNAQEADVGRYMCVVSNDAGIQSKNFKLSVNIPPTIAGSSPVDVISVQGSAATLFCDVYAVPTARITWMKNGLLVRNGDRINIVTGGTRLQIGSTVVSDAASYTCHAENDIGDARKEFNLIVHVPPSVGMSHTEVDIVQGDDETLQCRASGFPTPEITWYKNGVRISRSYPNLAVSRDGSSLTIYRAQLSDSAEYVCEAVNVAGRERGSVNVHILVPPTLNTDQGEQHIEVNAGNPVTMHCNVTGGIPPPSISWLRNGFPLEISERMQLLSGGKILQIIQSQESDTAAYSCIATNEAGSVSHAFDLDVYIPPTFQLDEDREMTIFAGETALLDCTVIGTPQPSVAWSKGESPIRGLSSRPETRVRSLADNQQVLISRAEVGDTGRYTCLAVSIAGQNNKNFDLNVYEPTRIEGSDETPHIVVNVGDPIDLICDATGVPVPVLTWTKNDDQPLIDNSRVLNNGRKMFVQSAQLSDAGTYTCIATSPAGVAEKDFDVTVNQPPTINDRGNDVTAVVGENVTLECKSDAFPPPYLSWFKDGKPLNKHERYLHLINVQVPDAGNYTCTATNVAGTTSQDTRLSVYEPPTIDAGPSQITATRGDTVKLPCVARGVPTPRIKWRKGSEQLNEDIASGRYVFLEEGSLMVEDIVVDDAGRFVCLASNSAGSERRIIELIVHVPPSITQGASNVTVAVNNPVTLDCKVEGIPQPTVVWSRNGNDLATASDPAYSLLGTGSLRIASAAVADAGYYRCIASNSAGRDHRDISLFVQVPPSISSGPNKLTKNPGDFLRIPCDVSGIPSPGVIWYKNGLPISDDLENAFVDETNGLVIPSISLEDDAIYVCSASNEAGSARHEVELEVHAHPVIFDSVDRVTVFEGQPASLPCDVSGTPEPTVTWRKGANLIDSNDESKTIRNDNSLLVFAAQVDDAGSYTCVAQNPAGVTSNSIYLDVYTPPKFDTELPQSMTVVVGESLLLPVSLSGHPEPDITWSKNGQEIPSEDGSLQIPVITSGHEGLYSIRVSNSAGSLTRYLRLIVNSAPEISPVGDPDVVVTEGEQISLGVTLAGKPWPEVTWTKDGEEITRGNFRFRVSNSGSLTIQNTRSSDTGHYIGTAINVAGRGSVEFDVLVQLAPVITEAPNDLEVNAGDRVEMFCAATGVPVPKIRWKFQNQLVPGTSTESPGKSRLVIEHARPQDSGAYVCEARNPAGSRMATAFLIVRSPPKFIDNSDPNQYDSLGATSMLDCQVIADPTPTITWTKNSQVIESNGRFELLNNGSLLIRSTELDDAGTYTCIAFNDAGTITRDKNLILESAPVIVTRPKNQIIDAGDTILLDCVANGEPPPTISWNKGSESVVFDDRTSILNNNSLRIVASRLQDTGEYECLAVNFKGIDFAASLVTIRVHGSYSDWSDFGSCSVTCGSGVQLRQRFCNNPPPANGGRDCEGAPTEEQSCEQTFCPIDGGYGLWTFWEECSATCGQGTRSRTRECNNPAPQYGGLTCRGSSVEQAVCVGRACAVNGGWSNWGVWLPCTASCGEATQLRVRHCNNPPPSGGGTKCFGRDTMTRLCNVQPCPVNGNWASWGAWEFCSVSCGGGTRNRGRTCSDPAPAHGGFLCSGPNQQSENCNNDPCSINGNWANWGTWSDCSRTCGGGQSNRYRSCTNPPPRHGGRFCPGTDSERLACGLRPCPVNGNWAPWGDWSECSQTCGFGQKTRIRLCNNPRPRNAGRWCPGDATQTDRCRDRFCQGGPREGEGIIFGTINDVSFGGSDIVANGTDIGDDRTRIIAKVSDVPPTVGHFLKSQISILTPIYWTMAREIQGAYNGYSLTEGIFDRTVSVEFASGDMVRMTHKAKGVDSRGKLKVEVAMEGNVPEVDSTTDVEIKDYTEDYVQTGPGSLYAYSDRLISLDGYNMPYTWQHNITYNETRGRMPYLVEQLASRDIIVEYDEAREELTFQMDVTIGKGNPSDRCPPGFLLDRSGMYCKDENECSTLRPCSHECVNVMGSYICSCPDGYMIGPDGRECEDVDECLTDQYVCPPTLDCLNTLGSYRCVVTCGEGFTRAQDGRTCLDIDECEESDERVCSHLCRNTIGSYICECRHGYRLNSEGQCLDINECLIRGVCRTDQRCRNTEGAYQCIDDCPQGMEKRRGVCVDINECTTGRHECGNGMICQNTDGGYNCVCPPGFKATGSDPPCADINECIDYPTSPCPHRCVNTIGSFKCICPDGLLYLADRKSCVGLILPSNPHYQHRHQQFSSYSNGRREPTESRWSERKRFYQNRTRSGITATRSQLSRRTRSVSQNELFLPQLVTHLTKCPPGLAARTDGRCTDIDECIEYAGICQHSCRNSIGSYTCICPQGYRVAENGKSCEDIDECAEGLMRCRTGQMCFNKRGSVTCIDTPCPPTYRRVSSGGYCLKESSDPNQPRYGIEYKTVALPFGIGANQDLVRLAVYTNDDVLHLNTKFKAHNTFGNPFGIRTDNYKGVVYTTRALSRSRTYHLEAKATSKTEDGRIEYETKFIIYISVAAHEF